MVTDRRELIDQLHDCITNLAIEAGDPDYTHEERARLIHQAKQIRDKRMMLRKTNFDAKTEGYKESIQAIDDVNGEISRAVIKINDIIEFLKKTANLVAALNRIIGAALPI